MFGIRSEFGAFVPYLLNNGAKTCLYGLKISENIEIELFFLFKPFFISVAISIQVASTPLNLNKVNSELGSIIPTTFINYVTRNFDAGIVLRKNVISKFRFLALESSERLTFKIIKL